MIPLTNDPAVIEPAKVQVTMLARQLFQLAAALKEYDARIAQLFASHADTAIWERASPGPVPRSPHGSAAPSAPNAPATRVPSLSNNTAASPRSPRRSGKNQHWVHRRWGRPHFLHQSFFEYANQSVLHCPWAELFLQEQIAKGKTYPTARRALAFKWQRIMFVCWRDRVAYQESTYLDSLKRRGSPLASKLELTAKPHDSVANNFTQNPLTDDLRCMVRCHVSRRCPQRKGKAGWWWINSQPSAFPHGHHAR